MGRKKGRHPYLSTMVRVDRALGEMVALLNSPSGPGHKELDERVEFLAYRLDKLVENVQDADFFALNISASVPPITCVAMQQFIVVVSLLESFIPPFNRPQGHPKP